jgi:hypothetical protein
LAVAYTYAVAKISLPDFSCAAWRAQPLYPGKSRDPVTGFPKHVTKETLLVHTRKAICSTEDGLYMLKVLSTIGNRHRLRHSCRATVANLMRARGATDGQIKNHESWTNSDLLNMAYAFLGDRTACVCAAGFEAAEVHQASPQNSIIL